MPAEPPAFGLLVLPARPADPVGSRRGLEKAVFMVPEQMPNLYPPWGGQLSLQWGELGSTLPLLDCPLLFLLPILL